LLEILHLSIMPGPRVLCMMQRARRRRSLHSGRCRYAASKSHPRETSTYIREWIWTTQLHSWLVRGIMFLRSVFHSAYGSVTISSIGSRGLGNRRRLQVVAALGLLSVIVWSPAADSDGRIRDHLYPICSFDTFVQGCNSCLYIIHCHLRTPPRVNTTFGSLPGSQQWTYIQPLYGRLCSVLAL